VDSLKALDPKRPIREADIGSIRAHDHENSPLGEAYFKR
jgi:hypothetical protein